MLSRAGSGCELAQLWFGPVPGALGSGTSLAPELAPDIALSIAPDLAPELAPDIALSIAPDRAPNLAPELALDLGWARPAPPARLAIVHPAPLRRRARDILLLTLLALGACRDDSVIEDIARIKDEVCRCQDKACVDALQASSRKLEDRLQGLSADDQAKAQRIAIDMMACVKRF